MCVYVNIIVCIDEFSYKFAYKIACTLYIQCITLYTVYTQYTVARIYTTYMYSMYSVILG